ncbi:TonB-dependent receptor [Gammaproteobacteria bacterium]|nr:TonB-dependent receptor [Gammaproteobacteria bacterium]
MNNFLKSAIPFAVLALVSFGSSVFADDEDEATDSVEEVVVTGSRISRASNYDSTGPVDVFTAQDVIDSGKTNIGDFLIELPSANLSANATNQRSVNNGNTGTTEFSLRGAGSERLLTLVNGRRVAPAGTGTGSAVDLQIFPLSLIDSVEVLKDGASAVYGSDAVSGVLNIKLRSFEGFEASIFEGSSDRGDANQDLISLAFGTTGERSSMVATIAQSKQDSLDMWDRDFSFCPRLEPDYMHYFQYFGIDGHGSEGEKVGETASCGASTFIPTGRFYTSEGSKTLYGDVGPNGPSSPFSFATYSGNRAGDPENNMGMYNYNQWMQLMGGRENRQAWSAGNYELDSGVVLDFQIGVSKRDSDLMMAPVPMGSGANFTYGLTIPADNPFNPFGEDLAYRKRMLDVGPRLFDQKSSNYRVEFGASGTFDRLGADWEAYSTYQDFSQSAETRNYINMLAVANSFDLEEGAQGDLVVNGTPYRCKDPIARQLGCVPLNMFGGNSITAEAADYIRQNEKRTYGTTYQGYAFNMTNIALYEMPAGEILMAVGAEMIDLSGFENVDGLTEAGGSSGNPRLSTKGSYDSRDIYGEISIPVLADITGFQELNIDYAYRNTQYSQFDSESVERTAIKWKPTADITVRATDSTSYKAPTISDLYFGGGGGFPTYIDPCESSQYKTYSDADKATALTACAAAGIDATTFATSNNQILVVNEGNPDLTPESGSNKTMGIVWQPTNIDALANIDFKIAVDKFEMEIANAVVSTGAQNTLNQCYRYNVTAFCDLLSRDYGGDVASVNTNNINSASTDVYEGTDYSINMTFDELPAIGGSLQVDVIGTHFDQYVSVDETGVSADRVGKCYNFGDNCFNRDRTNLTLRWYKDDYTVSLTTRFLSEIPLDQSVVDYYESDPYGFTEAGTLTAAELGNVYDTHSIDKYNISYLNINYSATDSVNLSLAVSNLFDKQPPYYKDLFGFVDPQINTPQNTYDIIGRYYTVGFKITL